jgi:hypothetical protein
MAPKNWREKRPATGDWDDPGGHPRNRTQRRATEMIVAYLRYLRKRHPREIWLRPKSVRGTYPALPKRSRRLPERVRKLVEND